MTIPTQNGSLVKAHIIDRFIFDFFQRRECFGTEPGAFYLGFHLIAYTRTEIHWRAHVFQIPRICTRNSPCSLHDNPRLPVTTNQSSVHLSIPIRRCRRLSLFILQWRVSVYHGICSIMHHMQSAFRTFQDRCSSFLLFFSGSEGVARRRYR